jgi:hypothetical protein
MPAAAIYTRVSTDEQARRGVSLEAQREACLAYCARSGLVVAAVIVDAGQTSRVPLAQRPANVGACGARTAEVLVARAGERRRGVLTANTGAKPVIL